VKPRKTRAERRAWWESLTAEEQAAQIRKWQLRKEQNPSRAALEASARLDIATERGVFMSAVSGADVAARLVLAQQQQPDEERDGP
jgi:hypothetical protein